LFLLLVFPAAASPGSGHREAIATSARAAVLLDLGSGRFLYEQNADQRLPMASTTKIMTALVVLESAGLDELVTVTADTVGVIGSSMYLRAGEKLTVRDLLYGLMLLSGNDAASTLAAYSGGSEQAFVEKMNAKAADLGLVDTRFANPHGLDADGHYTTARELAVLSAEALRNPAFAEIVKQKEALVAGRHMNNHNKMLRLYPGADGVKTGFTTNARRCLVSSATRGGQTLIAVTLNDGPDWADHTALLDYGFSTYPLRVFAARNDVKTVLPVIGGSNGSVALIPEQTLSYPLTDTEMTSVETSVLAPHFVYAGVERGKIAGFVVLKVNGKETAAVNLIYENTVMQARPRRLSLWERAFGMRN
jgi:D-alanyl-D-alanine carboxypeptidase